MSLYRPRMASHLEGRVGQTMTRGWYEDPFTEGRRNSEINIVRLESLPKTMI